MLLTIFGPPSGFTQWGVHVIRMLADTVLRDVDYVNTCEVNILRERFAERSQPHLFFFADCPEKEIVDIFLKTKARGIILYEEPDDVTGFIVRERNMDWLWASRLTNQCMMTIAPLIKQKNFLVVHRGEYETFKDFFDAIVSYLDITIQENDFAEIFRRVDPSNTIEFDTKIESAFLHTWIHARPIGYGMGDIVESIGSDVVYLNQVTRILIHQDAKAPIIWPKTYFIPGDAPSTFVHEELSLLGPARCVCFGPYLHLPAGEWYVEIEMEIHDNLSGNRMEIDVYHDGVITAETFRLPAEGRFVATARFGVDDPRNAVQFRFITKEGAIEGCIEIGDAKIYHVDLNAETLDEREMSDHN